MNEALFGSTRRRSAPNAGLILSTSPSPGPARPGPVPPVCCVIRQAQGPPVALADSTPFQWGLPLSQSQPWPWIPVTHTHTHTNKQSLPIQLHVHTHSQTSGVAEAHGDSPDRRHASRLVDEAEKPLWIVMVGWSLPFSSWATHKSGRQKLK